MFIPMLAMLAIAIATIVATVREPRRAANAPLLLGGIGLLLIVYRLIVPGDALDAMVLIALSLSPFLLLALVVVLIANGAKMIRRESRTLPHLLSGLAGIGLIAVTIGGFALVISQSTPLAAFGLWLLLATSWLGFLFVSMLIYQLIYSQISGRRRPDYIVVLGAGLANGKVGRILAARVATAARIARHWAGKGQSPILIMSGGQGADEPRPEAAAMAEYAHTELAVPNELMLLEAASTTTEENLRRTAEIVAADPRLGPDAQGLAVTSNFHVLRTADLARRLGLNMQATGAPVAPYYWPSATLREFVAQLVNHKWAVAMCTALVTLPLPLVVLLAS